MVNFFRKIEREVSLLMIRQLVINIIIIRLLCSDNFSVDGSLLTQVLATANYRKATGSHVRIAA